MSAATILLGLAAIWLAAAAVGWLVVRPLLRRGPGRDATTGLLWLITRAYCRLWHRVTFSGTEALPRDDDHGGLIVVSNHTGAIDPLLIQTACPFLVRWMTAADMMPQQLDWLWQDRFVIPVDRDGRDSGPLREAIRHVRRGGAVGIFPEGRITTPPREIRPFLAGVGLLIARTGAPVLLVWVSGTPDTNRLGEAIATRSRAHVRFIALLEDLASEDPGEIAEILRRRIAAVSGWPLNDEVLPPGGSQASAT